MSVMKTEEDLNDDAYWQFYNSQGQPIIQGYTLDNTPTDRRSSFRIHPPADRPTVQHEPALPRRNAWQRGVQGARQPLLWNRPPFGPPSFERYKDILRTPTYRRVDIGFSRELFMNQEDKNGFISLEIFNILGIRNTINHTWIEDVNGRLYAIPNYLTNRRVNLKVGLNF